MSDSKKLWMSIDKKIDSDPITLGRYASNDYMKDPIHLGIVASRYKFCARMFQDFSQVMEVGCGDGYGAAIVASKVHRLTCTDINAKLLEENRDRQGMFKNITYEFFDFRDALYPKKMDGIYLVDVIEHIYKEEENRFMTHLTASLSNHGSMIIGTPNKSAEKYSSPCSRDAHVNLKDHRALMELGKRFFHNVFLFGMNDEVLHTGYPQMAHYLWVLCASPRKTA